MLNSGAVLHHVGSINMWIVEYIGFLQTVKRHFTDEARAIQWARQVGVYGTAKIYKTTH